MLLALQVGVSLPSPRFSVVASDCLWVATPTDLPTSEGFVHIASAAWPSAVMHPSGHYSGMTSGIARLYFVVDGRPT